MSLFVAHYLNNIFSILLILIFIFRFHGAISLIVTLNFSCYQTMSQVIESVTSGNYRKKVRVFSLRGAHLIAMFARTDVAKEFRRWVLDILDREVANSPIAKQFTDEELCDLAWLWRAGAVMITACRDVYPLLRVAEHSQAGRFCSIGQEYPRTLNKARQLLKRETSHIEHQPWRDDNWSRVLPHLRQEMLQ